MDKIDLDPLAELLLGAYLDTAAYSKLFSLEHEAPPTLFSKVHHMRSVAQASINKSDRFSLEPAYTEFGRVQVRDEKTGHEYLLRSGGAYAIEHAKRQGELFSVTKYRRSGVLLLVQTFNKDGMDLGVSGTRQQVGKTRLEASGLPELVGTWPFTAADAPPPFDQGLADAFEELGDLPLDGEAEA